MLKKRPLTFKLQMTVSNSTGKLKSTDVQKLNTNTSFSGVQNNVCNHFVLFSRVILAFLTEQSVVTTTTKRIYFIGKISWGCKPFQVISHNS